MELSIDSFMEEYNSLLVTDRNKWIAFHGKEHTNTSYCFDDIYRKGLEKFGDVPMLLRQITLEYKIFGKYGMPIDFSNNCNVA